MTPPTPSELKIMRRHRAENFQERRVCRLAEPLLRKLKPGENRFSDEDFKALASYFIDQFADRQRAVSDGAFSVGNIVVRRKGGGV